MAEWLLIRLDRERTARATWLTADGAGRLVTAQREGPLAQAAPLAVSRRVCVLVPAAEVLLTAADVPIKSGARVQQIIPFALEEQLAEDVENLHFAVGRRPTQADRTPVAVVSKASMEAWLTELTEAGITAEALYAESELIPANPGQAVGLLDGDSAIVRRVGHQPVTMPIDALSEALALIRPDSEELIAAGHRGQGLVLYTGAAEWHRHSAAVERIRDRFDGVKIQLLTDGPLALLAQRVPAAAAGAINLLQGPYARKTSLVTDSRGWRIAALLLAALVVLHAGGSISELIALDHAEHRVDRSIVQTFRAAMPGQHNAIDARRRMEQRLESLGKGSDETGLLAALGALAESRADVGGTVVRALNFRGSTLELDISAPNAQALDRLSRSLRARGWQAELTAASTTGSGYEGHVEVKPGA
ncbi:MAG: type II secretion system protein GspL [Steroidobacteraceae bacterium]